MCASGNKRRMELFLACPVVHSPLGSSFDLPTSYLSLSCPTFLYLHPHSFTRHPTFLLLHHSILIFHNSFRLPPSSFQLQSQPPIYHILLFHSAFLPSTNAQLRDLGTNHPRSWPTPQPSNRARPARSASAERVRRREVWPCCRRRLPCHRAPWLWSA